MDDLVRVNHKHDQLVYQPYGPFGHTHEPQAQVARFGTGRSSNYLMVNDPVTDALYPKAMAAARVNDVDALKKALRDANERAARQHYAVSLLEPFHTLCVNRGLRLQCSIPFCMDGYWRP